MRGRPVATFCANYLRFAREQRLQTHPPELQRELDTLLEEQRQLARAALVEFAVLDPELARFAVVNREGLDATITRLCAPLDS